MGWSRGESLLCEAWEKIRDHVEDDEQVELLAELINLFEEYDIQFHTLIYDVEDGEQAMRQLHPDWDHQMFGTN